MLLSTQGPFPPRTLPRFPGTTDPSATLTARPAPRGVPVDVCCISVRASRVAALFLFHACRRQYPDGNGSVPVSLASPSANGLPLLTGGSASVLPVSRPARRSLAFRPAWSLNRPRRPFSPECFSPCRYLHGPPWLLPTGATVVGRGSHPPEEGAFPRRTVKDGLTEGVRARFGVRPCNLLTKEGVADRCAARLAGRLTAARLRELSGRLGPGRPESVSTLTGRVERKVARNQKLRERVLGIESQILPKTKNKV